MLNTPIGDRHETVFLLNVIVIGQPKLAISGLLCEASPRDQETEPIVRSFARVLLKGDRFQ